MRIAGLPIVCLVLLAAVAIKAGTAASRPSGIDPLPDQTIARSDVPQDTLTKADKLEIPYRREATRPVEPFTRLAGPTPEPSLPLRSAVAKSASRQRHEPNSTKVTNNSQDRHIKSPRIEKGAGSKEEQECRTFEPDGRLSGRVGALRALRGCCGH